ncbi:MAG: DNA-processing protein DprA [Chloroflexota bacterium]|nr:DNA-processing protein DprA [Chloroflexota bacterium]MDE2909252.1 DNA-processing protein DprA [Chloroflexota bacterium]
MKKADAASQLQWLALSLSPNIGAATLKNLLDYFDQDLNAILTAPTHELMQVRGVGAKIASEISAIDLERLAQDIEKWRAGGIELLLSGEEGYPPPLNSVSDFPLALFASRVLGAGVWANAVAIVGTRAPSKEARYITLQLAMQLARGGRAVVSGLALGIDTAAHSGALAVDGETVAVLGSGICNIYPEANRQLAERIRARGALLSETHPRWSANAQRLVARNRIISGLSQAVIVVESDADGGALHTAQFAREQGKPVFTFDLPASGNQRLIAGGAVVLRRDEPLRELPG